MQSSHLTDPVSNPAALGPPLIGALLRAPWETVNERMLAGLHQRGFEDVIPAHLNVMQYPGPQNTRPSDLADRVRMTRQALNYLLGQMEDLGYVERRPDQGDSRFKRVYLTSRGMALGHAMRDIVEELESEWKEQLGATRFAELRESLRQLGCDSPEPSSSN